MGQEDLHMSLHGEDMRVYKELNSWWVISWQVLVKLHQTTEYRIKRNLQDS